MKTTKQTPKATEQSYRISEEQVDQQAAEREKRGFWEEPKE